MKGCASSCARLCTLRHPANPISPCRLRRARTFRSVLNIPMAAWQSVRALLSTTATSSKSRPWSRRMVRRCRHIRPGRQLWAIRLHPATTPPAGWIGIRPRAPNGAFPSRRTGSAPAAGSRTAIRCAEALTGQASAINISLLSSCPPSAVPQRSSRCMKALMWPRIPAIRTIKKRPRSILSAWQWAIPPAPQRLVFLPGRNRWTCSILSTPTPMMARRHAVRTWKAPLISVSSAFFAKWLFNWLNWTHDHWISNWGWAIVLLTVIINLALLPTRISQMKMSLKMQKAQPRLQDINKKYEKYGLRDQDKQQQKQKEIMAVYKEEGFNPAGGCLPMLLQLPLLWALYAVLANTIELRHAPCLC